MIERIDENTRLHRGYTIRRIPNVDLWDIHSEKGGVIPRLLQGGWTSFQKAGEAIDQYLDAKVK